MTGGGHSACVSGKLEHILSFARCASLLCEQFQVHTGTLKGRAVISSGALIAFVDESEAILCTERMLAYREVFCYSVF